MKIIFWYDQLTTTNAPLNSSGAFELFVPYGSRVRRNQEPKASPSTLRRYAYLLYCICTKLCRNNSTSVLLMRNISILTIPYLLLYCIAMTWGFTDLVTELGIISRALSSLSNHILCRNSEFLLSHFGVQSRYNSHDRRPRLSGVASLIDVLSFVYWYIRDRERKNERMHAVLSTCGSLNSTVIESNGLSAFSCCKRSQ